MTAGKKFGLTFAIIFIAVLLIGIANKISVGLWLWPPNVLPDVALIIHSLVSAFTLTALFFGFLVEWPNGRKWLILAIIGLVFSIGLGLVTKAWPNSF